MDELLTNRYKALFAGYGVGGDRLVIDHVKGHLASREARYREDAMYFLLVNMDHMVVRALSGYIPGEDRSPVGYPMPTSIGSSEMINKIHECFDIIENHLETSSEERVDAHAVMRAINAAQQPLDVLLWWKGN